MPNMLRTFGGIFCFALILLGVIPEAVAQIGVNIINTPIVGGFNQPVHLTHAGDGSGRLFVVEQSGVIRIVQGGVLQPTPFLNITGRVKSGGEEGLLSAAFPPGFTTKKYFYVYYTNRNGDNQVSRFHLTSDNNVADPAREDRIIYFNHPTFSNHNGGQIAFGPEGYLYIGTGDGGGGGDPFGNAQNLQSLLGKLLRIAVEQRSAGPTGPWHSYLPAIFQSTPGPAYRIPPDNPFVNNPGVLPEIWALGLRNPWRFSFDRQTGDLYIGDVGQNTWEEVDFQPIAAGGGQNYGWNIMEGAHCFTNSTCSSTGLTLPVAEYDHTLGCSVTGGGVYRGSTFPGLQGIYFFADFCSGRIWGQRHTAGLWQKQVLLTVPHNISTFGEDEAGNLYYADRTGGVVYRIEQVP